MRDEGVRELCFINTVMNLHTIVWCNTKTWNRRCYPPLIPCIIGLFLFKSNHFYCHSTSALVSEILEGVLQTVHKKQQQFTYRQYLYLQTVQKTMCKKHCVYYKTYLITNTHCTHFTLCTHLYIVICEGATDYTVYSIFVQQYRLGATDYTYAMSWMCFVWYPVLADRLC